MKTIEFQFLQINNRSDEFKVLFNLIFQGELLEQQDPLPNRVQDNDSTTNNELTNIDVERDPIVDIIEPLENEA